MTINDLAALIHSQVLPKLTALEDRMALLEARPQGPSAEVAALREEWKEMKELCNLTRICQ